MLCGLIPFFYLTHQETIKENYSTFDKKSDEYVEYVNTVISDDKWEQYVEDGGSWLEDNENIELYKGVTIELIQDILKDLILMFNICILKNNR